MNESNPLGGRGPITQGKFLRGIAMPELFLGNLLKLKRCPHCGIANPSLEMRHDFRTANYDGGQQKRWMVYSCRNCGGVVSAYSDSATDAVQDYYPGLKVVDDSIPDRARRYLQQALESIHTPSGATMLAASAVDAMLKEKGLRDGNLYTRIKSAIDGHLITEEMGKWAHEVRLDANDERHADESATMPDEKDAKRIVEFAMALAEFLFVLPSRIQRGISDAKKEKPNL